MEREVSFEPRAILVADMVGYSRWLAQRPVATYAAFTSHVRHVFEPAVREHAGKIVKTTGDGAAGAVTLQSLILVRHPGDADDPTSCPPMPELIPSQPHLFDLPADVAYLNCAYMSPLLKRAAGIGADARARKCRPWRISAQDFFTDSERARALFAQLLGARAEDIALVPSASYGLAIAAANLPLACGQCILVLAEQFPSNVYTWRALAAQIGARNRVHVAGGTTFELLVEDRRVRAL